MTRSRIILGLVGGAMIIASAAAHSLLGWPQLRAALVQGGVPAALIPGLTVGWHFGGAAMLAFGIIVISLLVDRLRGRQVSLRPVLIIAVVYLLFGIGAIVYSRDAFFTIFVVPALLLLAASWGQDAAAARVGVRTT